MTVLILLIPILLQKAQNYMYLSSFYQQKTKNFQNVLTKDLKDVDIGMNIKQKSEKKNDKWV